MLVWFGIDYYMVDPGSFWESVFLKPQMEKLRNLDEEKKEGTFTFFFFFFWHLFFLISWRLITL